ncbi:MAG: transposase [Propionibacteriaceae bacterium]|jgi:transposase-like protein|nr:transposase [Propionibacteriaceae bacterium]
MRGIRRIICTTNAIESLNARYRRAVNARGHFPNHQATVKMPVPGDAQPGPNREKEESDG